MMPVDGVIFSDGVEHDFLRFDSGALASIGASSRAASLVVPDGRRTRASR
jgi:hypothetical protein